MFIFEKRLTAEGTIVKWAKNPTGWIGLAIFPHVICQKDVFEVLRNMDAII